MACTTSTSNNVVNKPTDNVAIVQPSSTGDTIIKELRDDELKALQRFAEDYEPRSGREVIPSPPEPNAQLSEIIAKAQKSGSRVHEKFIILIFLRLSRFQIEHFRQRYELGRENPLTQEFYRLIGRNDYARAEINLTYLADDYVDKHPELLSYAPIKAEMRRIEAAGSKLKQELESR